MDGREQICVGALMVRRDDGLRVLLGKRSATQTFYPDVWDVPGGHCEAGETPEQGLVRELEEELGVRPTAWRRLGCFRVPTAGRDRSTVLHLYEVTAWQGTPANRTPEEHAELGWFTVEDACRLPLADPAYRHLLRRLTPAD